MVGVIGRKKVGGPTPEPRSDGGGVSAEDAEAEALEQQLHDEVLERQRSAGTSGAPSAAVSAGRNGAITPSPSERASSSIPLSPSGPSGNNGDDNDNESVTAGGHHTRDRADRDRERAERAAERAEREKERERAAERAAERADNDYAPQRPKKRMSTYHVMSMMDALIMV